MTSMAQDEIRGVEARSYGPALLVGLVEGLDGAIGPRVVHRNRGSSFPDRHERCDTVAPRYPGSSGP